MASSWRSPDRLLILAVAGIGAYAIYRMSRSDAGRTHEGELKLLPAAPGPVAPAPADVRLVTGDPMPFTNSRAYQGRLETTDSQGGPLPPSRSIEQLTPEAPREDLTKIVESFGFEPGTVRVWMTAEEAAANGTAPFALQNAGRGTRWFYGRYLGPSADVRRPKGLAALWIVRGPAARTGEGLRAPSFLAMKG